MDKRLDERVVQWMLRCRRNDFCYGDFCIILPFVFKTCETIVTDFINVARAAAIQTAVAEFIFVQNAHFHGIPSTLYEQMFPNGFQYAILMASRAVEGAQAMKKLDNPQDQIYDFIITYTEKNAYPPSVREICSAVGLKSTSTVHTHLKNMEAKGLITRDGSKQRAMIVHPKASETLHAYPSGSVPLVGKVAAGAPILAVDNVEEAFPLPDMLMKSSSPDEVFMLRVQGDSMINAGINPGDILVINQSLGCDNGDIGIARIEGESATVKRIFREKDRIRLQPENDAYQPILVPYGSVEIIGKVTGLLRQL